ncbi:MAG: CAAX prenyl protease 1, partial [Paramarteilia canceri]
LYFILNIIPLYWQKSFQLSAYYFPTVRSAAIASIIFTLKSHLYSLIIDLPTSIFKTFYIEQKHGFNKQTVKFYAIDQIKQNLVGMLFSSMFISTIVKSIEVTGDYFVPITSAVTIVLSGLVIWLVPNFILPLFDRYEALDQEIPLYGKIVQICSKFKFPMSKVEVQCSGNVRSAHSNAFFVGICSKKIVFFDTLLKKQHKALENDSDLKKESKSQVEFEDEELLAILCHELGHWYYNHMPRTYFLLIIMLFLNLSCAKYLVANDAIFKEANLPENFAVKVLFSTSEILGPIMSICMILITFHQRKLETEADNFAVKNNYKDLLISALKKISTQNKCYPYYDHLFSQFNHSHPPLSMRIAAILGFENDLNLTDLMNSK